MGTSPHLLVVLQSQEGLYVHSLNGREPDTLYGPSPAKEIIKDATTKRFHYDGHDQLRRHLADFIDAYNYGRRLKTLKGLTPYEFICKQWTNQPERFTLNPLQQMPRLNTYTNGASDLSLTHAIQP